MLDWIELVALTMALVLSLVGIFHDEFEDNAPQRLGLAIIGFASACEIYIILMPSSCRQQVRAHAFFEVGFAIYAVGTAQKVIKHKGRD